MNRCDLDKLRLERWQLPQTRAQLYAMLQVVQASEILEGVLDHKEATVLMNSIIDEIEKVDSR